MHRPVLFLARSWHGYGGMQRLNHDVVHFVGSTRSSFLCLHLAHRSFRSFLSFCTRSVLTAWHWRGRHARIHLSDCTVLPLGILCAWISNATLSVTACGLDVVYRNYVYQRIVRWGLKYVDHVICISEVTAVEVCKRGVSRDVVSVIPCGISVDATFVEKDRSPFLLVTVGRLIQRKGITWFIESVLPFLREIYPDIHYCVIGNGPERRSILSVIRKKGLQNTVTLLDNASDDVRKEILERAQLFVAPNISVPGDMEGFGIVCIEASGAGLPIIAADIEGLKSAVMSEKTGRFFHAGDADDCVRMIRKMIDEPLAPVSVHQETLSQFSWNRLIPLYNNVFDS